MPGQSIRADKHDRSYQADTAGIIQADVGLNRILRNTTLLPRQQPGGY